jgi:large subunit ribosomal protein L30
MKIAVIRIAGLVGIDKQIARTLDALRLRRKYTCVILEEKPEFLGMLKKVKDRVAFGQIDKEILKELLLKRARLKGNKPIVKLDENFVDQFIEDKKKLEDVGIKPFFRLHSPRGGFKKSTKLLFPKGVLGNHGEKINELLKKML